MPSLPSVQPKRTVSAGQHSSTTLVQGSECSVMKSNVSWTTWNLRMNGFMTGNNRIAQCDGSSLPPSADSNINNSGSPRMTTTTTTTAPPPRMLPNESFEERAWRKFSQQPLVPIGCIATAYFLASGIRSFQKRDPVRSQKMMKMRVAAQFVTLLCFIGYVGRDNLDFRIAPMYQDVKKAARLEKEKQQLPVKQQPSS